MSKRHAKTGPSDRAGRSNRKDPGIHTVFAAIVFAPESDSTRATLSNGLEFTIEIVRMVTDIETELWRVRFQTEFGNEK